LLECCGAPDDLAKQTPAKSKPTWHLSESQWFAVRAHNERARNHQARSLTAIVCMVGGAAYDQRTERSLAYEGSRRRLRPLPEAYADASPYRAFIAAKLATEILPLSV